MFYQCEFILFNILLFFNQTILTEDKTTNKKETNQVIKKTNVIVQKYKTYIINYRHYEISFTLLEITVTLRLYQMCSMYLPA